MIVPELVSTVQIPGQTHLVAVNTGTVEFRLKFLDLVLLFEIYEIHSIKVYSNSIFHLERSNFTQSKLFV